MFVSVWIDFNKFINFRLLHRSATVSRCYLSKGLADRVQCIAIKKLRSAGGTTFLKKTDEKKIVNEKNYGMRRVS